LEKSRWEIPSFVLISFIRSFIPPIIVLRITQNGGFLKTIIQNPISVLNSRQFLDFFSLICLLTSNIVVDIMTTKYKGYLTIWWMIQK
jgi:hypothetical protein